MLNFGRVSGDRITPIYKQWKRPFGRGPTRSLGDLRSPWLLTTYKSWDDPPSGDIVCIGDEILTGGFFGSRNNPLIQISNEKQSWLFRVYRGLYILYYPIIWDEKMVKKRFWCRNDSGENMGDMES